MTRRSSSAGSIGPTLACAQVLLRATFQDPLDPATYARRCYCVCGGKTSDLPLP